MFVNGQVVYVPRDFKEFHEDFSSSSGVIWVIVDSSSRFFCMGKLIQTYSVSVFVFLSVVAWIVSMFSVYYDLEHVGSSVDTSPGEGRYYKSDTSVYYRHTTGGFGVSPQLTRISGADVETFTCVLTTYTSGYEGCRYHARDKNFEYHYGEIVQ